MSLASDPTPSERRRALARRAEVQCRARGRRRWQLGAALGGAVVVAAAVVLPLALGGGASPTRLQVVGPAGTSPGGLLEPGPTVRTPTTTTRAHHSTPAPSTPPSTALPPAGATTTAPGATTLAPATSVSPAATTLPTVAATAPATTTTVPVTTTTAPPAPSTTTTTLDTTPPLATGPYGFLVPAGWTLSSPLDDPGGPARYATVTNPDGPGALYYEVSGGETSEAYDSADQPSPATAAGLAGCGSPPETTPASTTVAGSNRVDYTCPAPSTLVWQGTLVVEPYPQGWKRVDVQLPSGDTAALAAILASVT